MPKTKARVNATLFTAESGGEYRIPVVLLLNLVDRQYNASRLHVTVYNRLYTIHRHLMSKYNHTYYNYYSLRDARILTPFPSVLRKTLVSPQRTRQERREQGSDPLVYALI